jgi:hypothetical protein
MNAIAHFFYGWSSRGGGLKAISLIRTSLLLVVLVTTSLGAMPQSKASYAPEASWDIYTVDGPAYFYMLTDRTLRFRSDGDACMAYGGDNLYYSCFDHGTETWQTELIDGNTMVGSHASLAINAQDKPYISYYDAAEGDLKLAYVDPFNVWQIITIENAIPDVPRMPRSEMDNSLDLDAFDLPIYPTPLLESLNATPIDDLGIGKYTSIAIDNLGGIHISYYDDFTEPDSGMLKYAYWNGIGLPTIDIVQNYHDQGDVGLWTSIAVDDENVPHIAYMSEKYDDLMYAYKRNLGVWEIEQVDSSAVGTFASIALDSANRPHISYFDFGRTNLRHAYRIGRDTWGLNIVDDRDSVGYYSSIAINKDNEIFISYYNATNGNLKIAQTKVGSWTTWKIDTPVSAGDVGYYSSIALKKGFPSIFFFNLSKGHMQYIWWDTGLDDWDLSTLTEHYIADVGVATSLALSTAGAPHISYMDDTRDRLKYAQTLSLTWETTVVTNTIHAGSWSSIGMLNDLQPAISFYDMTNRDLLLTIWDGFEWVDEEVDTEGIVGQYVSMKIASNGDFHLSYYDASLGLLKYAFREHDDDNWEITILDNGDAGKFTSIDLDPFDRPYISYFDAQNEVIKVVFKSATDTWVDFVIAAVGDPTDGVDIDEAYTSIDVRNYLNDIHISFYNETLGDLEYAYFDGSWNHLTIDSTGDVGKYNSLEIDTNNPFERHICYYDATERDLKYANWDGTNWTTEVVDGIGDVGRFCSLALNSAGQTAISYYDDSGRDLKYATSFPLPDVQISEIFLPMLVR